MEKFSAVRGAVQITEDNEKTISFGTIALFKEIIERNNLAENNLISIIISQTKDLTAMNAATALRKDAGVDQIPLFCVQECDTDNAMPRVVRFLIHVVTDHQGPVRHVYLHGAEKLRPDQEKR
jgi:chorismate mutase